MSFWEEFEDFLTETVVINSQTGFSKNAKATYSTSGSTYAARIMSEARREFDVDGKRIVAQYKVILGTTDNIKLHDKITLPSRYEPTSPSILGVAEIQDETGMSHVELFLGSRSG
jgi:hypothetical protein